MVCDVLSVQTWLQLLKPSIPPPINRLHRLPQKQPSLLLQESVNGLHELWKKLYPCPTPATVAVSFCFTHLPQLGIATCCQQKHVKLRNA